MGNGVLFVAFAAMFSLVGFVCGGSVESSMREEKINAVQDSLRISHYDRHTGKRILDSVEFRGDTLIIHRKDK